MLVSCGDPGGVCRRFAASRHLHLREEIRHVVLHRLLCEEHLLSDLTIRHAIGDEIDDPLIRRLSPQERRILDLIADGKTNRQIAEEMFLAEKTVKNYVSNLLAKMEMSRRSEAAAYAARVATRHEHQYPPEEWTQ